MVFQRAIIFRIPLCEGDIAITTDIEAVVVFTIERYGYAIGWDYFREVVIAQSNVHARCRVHGEG
ncbi:MAG: hypothetical protein BWY71_02237 [Planctomycetes bacterium ADurb.Bin412]|nr:MAG: hypothetical protein BWY71_02237 [Planctomycetes bacterium ADurb.Bin412]